MPLWRKILRQNFTNVQELASFLDISHLVDELHLEPEFILNLPRRLAAKIEKGSLTDPLFLQFVPLQKETRIHPDFSEDPVADSQFVKVGSLLQKYQARVLLVTTSACAMHCRYCFRKNFGYETKEKNFTQELDLIRNDPSLEEVILSGGDPLSLSDAKLQSLLEEIERIPHIKRIRFHTRFPMGIPERIDTSFLALLENLKKQCLFVIHANHPREFDEDIWLALKKIQRLGIPLLCQTVLLKGINDSVQTQQALFSLLTNHGVLPYYLHQLDQVQGASHFEVSKEEGLQIIQSLQALLPGYAIPKYVKEVPGKEGKLPLT
jgi:lysine 2,3-aminomutase